MNGARIVRIPTFSTVCDKASVALPTDELVVGWKLRPAIPGVAVLVCFLALSSSPWHCRLSSPLLGWAPRLLPSNLMALTVRLLLQPQQAWQLTSELFLFK